METDSVAAGVFGALLANDVDWRRPADVDNTAADAIIAVGDASARGALAAADDVTTTVGEQQGVFLATLARVQQQVVRDGRVGVTSSFHRFRGVQQVAGFVLFRV